MLQVHAENMCTFWHDIPGITYWIPGICLFEYRGLNQAGGRGGPCWKLILFTLQRSLQYVICLLRYRGELLFCLIDNMLDGKLWLFPSRQEKEEEISSPVSFDLQTLHISPCRWQSFLSVWATLQVRVFVQSWGQNLLCVTLTFTLYSWHQHKVKEKKAL